ncbi:hypothetical protein CLAFUW4_03143 [Fulvia fulva]|uniref:Uncharacterized protein n=1 Tax=Passalora fulva TaxID=5499 RepID=A0A9Q8LBU0_PASFU|nr:uncharacterized protein CLAFUR5_03127 [Fulvia fulva]KAK4630932.1 hypothetical protein CLAFUR4_03133 [Fulvia fulva]KAK4633894.1 hypothetical protein CLAFUR0_03138 [Fulvia fulva]UJO14538.1 hypothetical protein CLAFUR5_03127 [Fulvia fulva]WPV11505.1 hypothetical protein CLAFUW4_03143 [Fulvia fulva]WPV25599.1 hypothetical protein CLAFUW7_03137 [Fulvia fulva]
MNYCIVAFAIVFIISMITWIFDGRKNYTGPKVEMDDDVLVATQTVESSSSPERGEWNGKGSDGKPVV